MLRCANDEAPVAEFTLDKKQNSGKVGMGVLSGAAMGATAGASIGTAITPGYGTAIGAAVGAIAGGIRGGATAGIVDKNEQRSAFEVEQAADAAKNRAMREANADVQASARSSSAARPSSAANYTARAASTYATPGAGLTGYDAWKQGG